MAKRSLAEGLDSAVEALLARPDAASDAFDAEAEAVIRPLARLARQLRGLPSEAFRDRLAAELAKPKPAAASYLPSGYNSVTLYLTARRAAELLDFVKQAFGAAEVMRATGSAGGMHAEVSIGDSKVMIGGGEVVAPENEMPAAIHLYVPDADAVYRQALAAGATSLSEPVDQPYGDREAGVKDLAGNTWYIATHQGAVNVPEGLRTVTPYLHPRGAPALIEFLKQAFGAEEIDRHQSPDGIVHHAKIRIGDSIVEIGEAHGRWQPMPTAIYLYVEDVDAAYRRAVEAGGTGLLPPTDQTYGARNAWVKDPHGHTWYIASPIARKSG
jgi:PhnB protein